MDKMVERAKQQFSKFDANGNGLLDGEELEDLAAWLWKSFKPGGQEICNEIKEVEGQKLLNVLDANGDGVMSFAEFEPSRGLAWPLRGCGILVLNLLQTRLNQ